jgi:3-methylcrotonyl-CoA carboxylase alpha subunit/acetyl-CoA/propionyl-CoA carboxylase biotin carboxyl carrier protein
VQEASVLVAAHHVQVSHLGHTFTFDRPDAFGPGRRTVVADGTVTAPMPGTVLSVSAAVGHAVEEGQVLGVMEAMKMELTLKAPFAGTVTAVSAAAGDQVALGAELFCVEEADG